MVCRTTSQCPLRMSFTNDSVLSTTFKLMPVSSWCRACAHAKRVRTCALRVCVKTRRLLRTCSAASEFSSRFSFMNCCISRMMLSAQCGTTVDPPRPVSEVHRARCKRLTHSAESISSAIDVR